MKPKPHSGIYGDPTAYRAYKTLQEELDLFIPDHTHGAHIRGAASGMRAKAKMIKNLAQNLVEASAAVAPDRK